MAQRKLLMAICIVYVAVAGEWGAQAQTMHHVVGGDRGWDPNSDLAAWSHARLFRVGDKIWFTYSAAVENIVELKSKEEFEACDVSNPIKMMTDGLDVIPLEEEGIRYFASGKPGSCENGLKLNVEVQSQSTTTKTSHQYTTATNSFVDVADGPSSPSGSTLLNGFSFALFVGLLVSYFGLM